MNSLTCPFAAVDWHVYFPLSIVTNLLIVNVFPDTVILLLFVDVVLCAAPTFNGIQCLKKVMLFPLKGHGKVTSAFNEIILNVGVFCPMVVK